MQNELTTIFDDTHSLTDKVAFLSDPKTYGDTSHVEIIETHMSWIFLTDQFAYKLKKPVFYDFLDFRSLESRHFSCEEEVRINQPLAGDTYIGTIAINTYNGKLRLGGQGEPVDWLVKMKRLPEESMLHTAIRRGSVPQEWVQRAAEVLVNFYGIALTNRISAHQLRQQILRDIESNSTALLSKEFKLQKSIIVSITADLLHFVVKHAHQFDQRIAERRIVDGHGDLRPEHICLRPKPVIIDRIEFNRSLRILDVAEELSFLAMECEMMSAATVGQLFLNVYTWKSNDKIPDTLINFYKAKRAFLRAKLSIHHLMEKKYQIDEQKWVDRCNAYLQAANAYCERLPKDY